MTHFSPKTGYYQPPNGQQLYPDYLTVDPEIIGDRFIRRLHKEPSDDDQLTTAAYAAIHEAEETTEGFSGATENLTLSIAGMNEVAHGEKTSAPLFIQPAITIDALRQQNPHLSQAECQDMLVIYRDRHVVIGGVTPQSHAIAHQVLCLLAGTPNAPHVRNDNNNQNPTGFQMRAGLWQGQQMFIENTTTASGENLIPRITYEVMGAREATRRLGRLSWQDCKHLDSIGYPQRDYINQGLGARVNRHNIHKCIAAFTLLHDLPRL